MLALAEALRRIEEATLLYGLGGILLAAFFIAVIIFRPSGLESLLTESLATKENAA